MVVLDICFLCDSVTCGKQIQRLKETGTVLRKRFLERQLASPRPLSRILPFVSIKYLA